MSTPTVSDGPTQPNRAQHTWSTCLPACMTVLLFRCLHVPLTYAGALPRYVAPLPIASPKSALGDRILVGGAASRHTCVAAAYVIMYGSVWNNIMLLLLLMPSVYPATNEILCFFAFEVFSTAASMLTSTLALASTLMLTYLINNWSLYFRRRSCSRKSGSPVQAREGQVDPLLFFLLFLLQPGYEARKPHGSTMLIRLAADKLVWLPTCRRAS